MVVVNLVYGLTLPLLSIVLDAQGVSKTMIGLSIVAQASAGVLLAPLMPRLITRSGAARVMRHSTLLAAATLIALGLFQNVYAWFAMRFLLGAAGSMLWSASEAVINELVDDDWRGRIIGVYGSAGAAGFALGPIVLILTGTQGLLPFIVTVLFRSTIVMLNVGTPPFGGEFGPGVLVGPGVGDGPGVAVAETITTPPSLTFTNQL